MHVIMLSGGSGKRLWPLSTERRAKQFLPLFSLYHRKCISMIQRVYQQICQVISLENIIIATSGNQVGILQEQLGENVSICIEPCRRDTFPAIALASAYLRDVKKVDLNEGVVVCPVDHYVEVSYFEEVCRLARLVEENKTRLMLMGIEPTYPSEKYGYILPVDKSEISKAVAFQEKPDLLTANRYIAEGWLWNSGVFAYRLDYALEKANNLLGTRNYCELLRVYQRLPRTSFDYAVAEQEKDIGVLRYQGIWKDIGTWDTLVETLDKESMGDVTIADGCTDVHAINELGVPILCTGLKDIIVVASSNGILVSDKHLSGNIKPYVDDIEEKTNKMY